MACSVTITSVIGRNLDSSGRPQKLDIRGTASGCSVVFVGALNQSQEVVVDADGNWWAPFDVTGVQCNETIKTVAFCKDHPDCRDPSGTSRIQCVTGKCPGVSLRMQPGACDEQGNRLVTLEATFSAAPTPTVYYWDFGDGSLSASSVLTDTVATTTHPYDPAGQPYTAALNFTLPAGCPPATVVVGHFRPCPAPTCPDRLDLEVRTPNNVLVDTDPDAACLQAGMYTVTVIHPVDDGSFTYYWSVNGLSDPTASGSSFDYALTSSQTATIAVTVWRDGCPPIQNAVTLNGCAPPSTCPAVINVEVRSSRTGQIVSGSAGAPCVPAGAYVISVTQPPASSALTYSWSADGVLDPTATGRSFTRTVGAGTTSNVSVTVSAPDCPPVSTSVILTGCTTRPGNGNEPGNGNGNGNGKSSCVGLIWAAVIALALGIVLLAIYGCLGVPYLQVIGWALVALYGVLMGIWRLMEFFRICHVGKCRAAQIHLLILGPLAMILSILIFFFPCLWPPALYLLSAVLGFWGAIATDCIASRR